MTWSNGPLIAYHGTDDVSADAIRRGGIDPAKFRPKTDFGSGFYLTTILYQAEQWANQKCRRASHSGQATVLKYEIPRQVIEPLRHLTFVVDGSDYYDFVAYCRSGSTFHGPGRARSYDVIYGPVSLWPQNLTIANCDQVLFSNPAKIAAFGNPSQSVVPNGGGTFF